MCVMTDDDRIIIEGSGGVDPEDSSVPQLGDGGLLTVAYTYRTHMREGHLVI